MSSLPPYEMAQRGARDDEEGCMKPTATTATSPPSPRGTGVRSRSSIAYLLAHADSGVFHVKTRLQKFVDGPFDRLCCSAIILNVAFVFVQLQYQGSVAGAEFSQQWQWPDCSMALRITEIAFNLFFAAEVGIRIFAQRMKFFYNNKSIEKLHLFDTFLVVISFLDLARYLQMSSSRGMNLNVLRPFRFFRLLRTLRILRAVRAFNKLKELVDTVVASFMALFWSILLLTIVMLMAALFLCQSLVSSLEDQELAHETRAWIFRMYGTSTLSFYTVFELTFSGGWPNYVRLLVEDVSSWYGLFFFIYIILVTFAMFRIVTALFLRDTMSVANSDVEIAVQERMKQKEHYAAKILEFFTAGDTSNDGMLSLEEFEAMLSDEKAKTWLSLMEMEIHDTVQVFHMLDDGDGLVSPSEFVDGILRLKGSARSQDVMRLMHYSHKLIDEVACMANRLSEIEGRAALQPVKAAAPISC